MICWAMNLWQKTLCQLATLAHCDERGKKTLLLTLLSYMAICSFGLAVTGMNFGPQKKSSSASPLVAATITHGGRV
jgi:hypothetical protein